VSLVLRPLFGAAPLFAAGLLPGPLRAAYGLPWDDRRERAFAAWATASRRLVPALPAAVRLMPQARRAGVDAPVADAGSTLHFGAEMS
jgi:uncharacterized protein (DUF2236 family)